MDLLPFTFLRLLGYRSGNGAGRARNLTEHLRMFLRTKGDLGEAQAEWGLKLTWRKVFLLNETGTMEVRLKMIRPVLIY